MPSVLLADRSRAASLVLEAEHAGIDHRLAPRSIVSGRALRGATRATARDAPTVAGAAVTSERSPRGAAQLEHRAALEHRMDPRARALLHALEAWLPPHVAWERAVSIAGPLLLLDGAASGSVRPSALDPARAIGLGLRDASAMEGISASDERIAEAAYAWHRGSRVSQTRMKRVPE